MQVFKKPTGTPGVKVREAFAARDPDPAERAPPAVVIID